MKLFKLDERDYKWIILILLGIIGMILVYRLNDNGSVVNIISMIASGASTALAVIAIMQSISYNESANSTYNAITEKLINLEHNTNDIKQNIMKDVNAVIENNNNIDVETKTRLQATINNVVSSPEDKKRQIEYSKKILSRCIKILRRIYNTSLVSIKNNRYGVQGFIDKESTKLEIYVTYLTVPDVFDEVNVSSFLNKFLKDAKDNNKYMIVICDGLISEIHDIIENSSEIFLLTEDDVMEGSDDEIARIIKLPFKRIIVE